MAERRMFAKSIVDSDAFIEMPMSARLLYYDLGMRADDDGFVNSPKKIMRFTGATNDDMNVLIMRKFVIAFDNGVVVIKHWRIHNYIQKDRYKPTNYKEQRAMLETDENGSYRLSGSNMDTKCIQNGSSLDSQVRIGKSKDRLELNNSAGKPHRPTVEEVRAYCQERKNRVDPEQFVDFYESKGWMIGKNSMKDWKAAVRTWERDKGRKKMDKWHPACENGDSVVNLDDIAATLDDF